MPSWLQGALCRAVKKPHLPGRLTSTCSTHFWPLLQKQHDDSYNFTRSAWAGGRRSGKGWERGEGRAFGEALSLCAGCGARAGGPASLHGELRLA